MPSHSHSLGLLVSEPKRLFDPSLSPSPSPGSHRPLVGLCSCSESHVNARSVWRRFNQSPSNRCLPSLPSLPMTRRRYPRYTSEYLQQLHPFKSANFIKDTEILPEEAGVVDHSVSPILSLLLEARLRSLDPSGWTKFCSTPLFSRAQLQSTI